MDSAPTNPDGGQGARPTADPELARRIEECIARLRAAAGQDGRALSQALFADGELLRQYLLAMRVSTQRSAEPTFYWHGSEMVTPYVSDALARFFHTLALLPAAPGGRLLELGANPYLLSMLVRRIFDFEATYTNFFGSSFEAGVGHDAQRVANDLTGEEAAFEYDLFNMEVTDFPYPDASFDVVLFCEVLEHLVLDALVVLDRIRRVLRPGGLLVLTTPNAVRLANVAAMLAGSNFFDRYHPQNGPYARHHREFTVEELRVLAEERGFAVETLVTLDRYDYRANQVWKDNYEQPARLRWTPRLLRWRLRLAGGTLGHRGDNIYLVARKLA